MVSFLSASFYVLVFISLYVQVFFLVTFLENRKKIITRQGPIKLKNYPAVTIVVPGFNEEKTIYKTVRSLLNLNYPQNKLKFILIDDGSTDGTWNVLQKFFGYPNIKIFKKENGGKHTALNLGLENTETEFFGCLDADSMVHLEALSRIMSYFESDKEAMAVVPSVTVSEAKNFVQNAQKAEYDMGVYMKKMLDFLGAINVTPGPFTIFRKKVFEDLGPYRQAHNTEDMEIAYRMQINDYKIVHCNDAYVYTNIPGSIGKLYRQRLRWIYGFINNTIDYRKIILKRKHGNFALFTLPTGVISIFTISYLFGRIIYKGGEFFYSKIVQLQTVGFNPSWKTPNLDLFFVDINMSMFLVILVYGSVIFAIIFGGGMLEEKRRLSLNMIYFFLLFRLVAPVWIVKAVWNTVLSRVPKWR